MWREVFQNSSAGISFASTSDQGFVLALGFQAAGPQGPKQQLIIKLMIVDAWSKWIITDSSTY
jgi:hypothetical protein